MLLARRMTKERDYFVVLGGSAISEQPKIRVHSLIRQPPFFLFSIVVIFLPFLYFDFDFDLVIFQLIDTVIHKETCDGGIQGTR